MSGKVSDKIVKIAEFIKERTATKAYRLVTNHERVPDIAESKFGGLPYWDGTMEYPKGTTGEKMYLLAQINFSNLVAAGIHDDRLPQKGLVQIFIAASDDLMYGCDYEDPEPQKNYRVIYHETIDEAVTRESVEALGLPVSDDLNEDDLPLLEEMAVDIQEFTAYMEPFDENFGIYLSAAAKELFGDKIDKDDWFMYVNEDEYDYLCETLEDLPEDADLHGEQPKHRIFGYPYFTQSDPRVELGCLDYYDTLLLQIDSEFDGNACFIMWGDSGVGNFFINSEALKKADFSRIMYNWDCY